MLEAQPVQMISVSRETPFIHATQRVEGSLTTVGYRIVVSPLDLFAFTMDVLDGCYDEAPRHRNHLYLRAYHDDNLSLPGFLARFDEADLADPEAIDAVCGQFWAECQEWWQEMDAKGSGKREVADQKV